MQIVLSDKRTYISTIEFRNTIPIVNIERLRSFKEEGVTGNFTKKEFRYSFDNIIWSPWQTLNSTNFTSISFLDNQSFYIHVKYSRSSVIAGNINSFYITYDSATISSIHPSDSSWEKISADASINFINVGDGSANIFAGIDASDNIQLRSITGIGAAIVSEVGDLITVSIDASFFGDPNLAENIGTGKGVYSQKRLLDNALLFKSLDSSLKTVIIYSDASNVYFDISTNLFLTESSLGTTLYWTGGVLNVSTGYVDGSLALRDVSINELYINGDNQLIYIDGSLGLRDASINQLYIYIDGSLSARDLSINELYSLTSDYIKEASLGTDFVWTGGLLDVSIVSGYSPEYIDGSLAYRDISINTLYLKNLNQDISLNVINVSLGELDIGLSQKVNRSGDTITGSLTVDGSLLVNGNTFYVDISNNRVGVRTTLPEAPLHVLSSTGDIMYVQHAGQSKFNLGAGAVSGTSYLRWGQAPSGVALVIGANSAVEIGANSHIANLGLGDIYVNRYGFFEDGIGIGIGTTIPQYTLDVSGTAHIRHRLSIDSSIDILNQRIHGLLTPANPSDGSNRFYVDVSVQALRLEQPWALDNSVLSPASADYDIQLSSIQMQTDGGEMTLVDMSITAAEASGNIHSYSFDIDGSKALRIEAVADSSSIIQKYIVETVDYHYIGEPSINGSWRYFIDASTDLQFQKRVAGIWVNSQKLSV